VLNRANHYWQINHPTHGNSFWHNAVYHTGNMAAYKVTGDKEYLAYSYVWAEHNEWKGAKSYAREVMEYQMSTPRNDYWWWADVLYMVMPVMTKQYNIIRLH